MMKEEKFESHLQEDFAEKHFLWALAGNISLVIIDISTFKEGFKVSFACR